MKKILLGISVILFSMACCLFGEVAHISLFYGDFAELVYVLLSIVGLGLCIVGYFEKDR